MFEVGDKVVYPMYGAGIIEAIEEKEVLGEKREYYVLRFPVRGMKVMIPTQNIKNVGMRQVISREEADKVVDILKSERTEMPSNWNKRYKFNLDKIKSGDIYKVAEVVRNLTLRDREKGLSTVERNMLNNARQILISELALSRNCDENEISAMIDELI